MVEIAPLAINIKTNKGCEIAKSTFGNCMYFNLRYSFLLVTISLRHSLVGAALRRQVSPDDEDALPSVFFLSYYIFTPRKLTRRFDLISMYCISCGSPESGVRELVQVVHR
jgi:hypothetical protein